MQTAKEIYVVWINAELKIATFHGEHGYEKKVFTKHREFMDYLQQLSMKHFRFK